MRIHQRNNAVNRMSVGQLKLKESEIKNQIKSYLRYTGWFTFPILQGLGVHKGISDMIAIRNGIVIFIEVKTENGKQSQDQKQFEYDIVTQMGNYCLTRSIEDVQEYIKKIGEE
jgi:Holliday junction resolvase